MKALRYMMAAVLVLALLCAGAAMASDTWVNNAMTNPTNGLVAVPAAPGATAVPTVPFKIEMGQDDTSFDWEIQMWKNGSWVATGMKAAGLNADTNIDWYYTTDIDKWLDVTGEEKLQLVVTDHKKDGTKATRAHTFYVDWNSDKTLNNRLTLEKWFPHNTACVYGPKMNALVPGIGSKDNITAAVVDLTKEGTQTFKLVAADQWEIGKVFVNVNGDEVTVTYQMTEDINKRDIWDEVIVEKEWFTIFPTKASITSAKRDDLGDGYTFGAPISIANDLGGATTVVLYVNSTVTYGAHNPYVYRFWTNSRYETGARNAMMDLYNSVAD